jgi:hypothetical protein
MNVNKPPLLYEMKKKLLLPCPPASKTMMKNPVKLCDLKKQTKISIEPVSDRELLT